LLSSKKLLDKEKDLREYEAQQIRKHFEKLERDTNKAIEQTRKTEQRKEQLRIKQEKAEERKRKKQVAERLRKKRSYLQRKRKLPN
jgi:hypothetical protein